MASQGALIVLGLAAAGAWAFTKLKPQAQRSTADAVIDPQEKASPNAEAARAQIAIAMSRNSLSLYESTAQEIERLRMPLTAGNLRGWASMAKQGGNVVAGDSNAVAGEYDDDEIGAKRRRARQVASKAKMPEWLLFQLAQSKLSGDPSFVRATAKAAQRLGYGRAAAIHLETARLIEKS